MLEYWKHEPTCFSASNVAQRAVDSIHVVKKDNANDPHMFAVSVLCQCPGVSVAIAEAILRDAGPHLLDVFSKDEKTLASIAVTDKRKVGPAVAKRLLGLVKH
jgi:hypothetical protein